jgi:hypothetical protein
MCDIKDFRFRHSLRFGVRDARLKYICCNFEWKYSAVIYQWPHELHVPQGTWQQFRRFNYMDVIPLEAAKHAVFIFLSSVIPMWRMRTNLWGVTLILCDHVNNQLDACDIRHLWAGQNSQYTVWQRAGRPGDGRSIPDRRDGLFPLASVSRPNLGPTQPPVQWVPGSLPGAKARPRHNADQKFRLVPRTRMSRSYTSSALNRIRGVY